MTETAASLGSGKDHTQENFPVASWLVRADERAPIMAYYRFARAADDIADHPATQDGEKLRLLSHMRAGLMGSGAEEAMALADIARQRGLDLVHAHDLLDAFTLDVTKRRYQDWDDLMAYCRLSAMPVGRFVLDVHGEKRALWPLSDALCAALQVINHLQDCGKDYHTLDRVYIPEPMLESAGTSVSALSDGCASPPLRAVITHLAERTRLLLTEASPFACDIRDVRLAGEVAVIQRLAEDLVRLLITRDPLSESVHHGKGRAAILAIQALLRQSWRRICA